MVTTTHYGTVGLTKNANRKNSTKAFLKNFLVLQTPLEYRRYVIIYFLLPVGFVSVATIVVFLHSG